MLTWLQIKHFAIADHIELDLRSGLSVITGETGAGKSIIINALSIVLGQRAEANLVKHGHDRAEIQVNFDITKNPGLQAHLAELALDEGEECQLRRVINAESGSKAYVNGRAVTANVLRAIGDQLIDIHGQHEHQSLLRTDTQLILLDQYAGIGQDVDKLNSCYSGLQHAIQKLETLRQDAALAEDKLAFLQFQAEELARFSPLKDEWESLYASHQRIHHQAELNALLQTTQDTLFSSGPASASASSQLNGALTALHKAQDIDPDLFAITQLLQEAQTLVNESEDLLRIASESTALDNTALEAIELRYSTYMDFARKHRVNPEDLYETHQAIILQLDAAQNPQKNEAALRDNIDALSKRYKKIATTISKQRQRYAKQLSDKVSEGMQALSMKGGEFVIRLLPVQTSLNLAEVRLSSKMIGRESGYEKVQFEVSTNAGMPILPLAKIASGGELSRISLVLQLILSDLDTTSTLVFDEIDVGVGGKTAAVIGKMLAKLASSRQIVCITHLAQVAAFGTQHYHVEKTQGKQVQLNLQLLNNEGRIIEIARMVGGETLTNESLAHARTLIKVSSKDE